MTISTYSELQTALENYTGRSDTAFTDRVPEFISQGENYINRRIRWNPGIVQTTVTLTAGQDTAALPTGFREIIKLKYPNNDYYLEQIPLETLLSNYDDTPIRPNYFAVADTFRFEAPSDATYSLDCDYYKKWDIATDTTNALLTQYEDVYLHFSLWRAFMWMRNNDQASQHFQYAVDALNEVNRLYTQSAREAKTPVDAALISGGRATSFNIFNGF